MAINVDFSKELTDSLNLAFGAEYREEEFSIVAGETASYIDGGLGAQGFSTSTNGFAGFSPAIAGSFSRANTSIYADLEWTPVDALLVAAAIRYEDFDDFGTTTNLKLGANYSITDAIGVRGTISSGFKAPTPGQSNASNISTQFVNGQLTNQGTIPSTSPVSRLKGGDTLDPEESTGFTLGAYFGFGPVDLTIDYFDIDLEDRLSLSNTFTLTSSDRAVLLGQGIDASDITEFRFFTNQFDTNTSGIDVVATLATDWLEGTTTWNLAFNMTDTEVTRRNPELLDNGRVRLIEDGVPGHRLNLTANHQMDNMRFLARVNHYGDFYDNEAGGVFDSANTVDLEFGYNFSDRVDLAIGARNVFDELGCSTNDCGNTPANVLGLKSSQFNPFGINGAFYYTRINYNF